MLWTHEDNYLPAPAVPLMDELPVWIWMSSWACWAGPEELSGRPTSPVCSAPALRRALVWPPVLEQPCRAFQSSFVMQTFAFVGQKEPCVWLRGTFRQCLATKVWWEKPKPLLHFTLTQSCGSSAPFNGAETHIFHCCLVYLEEWHFQVRWPENCNYKSVHITKQSDSFLGLFRIVAVKSDLSSYIWY